MTLHWPRSQAIAFVHTRIQTYVSAFGKRSYH